MTDSINPTIFTNQTVSPETSDLLQKAIQQVIDEDNNENQFVTLLRPEEGELDAITLTPAQAAALGYSFEIDTIDDSSKTLWNNQPGTNLISKDGSEEASTHVSVYQDFTAPIPQNKIKLVSECDVQDWNAVQNVSPQVLENFKVTGNAGRAQKKSDKFNTTCFVNKSANRQFVRKPAQNVTKNVRILPNVGKVEGLQFDQAGNQGSIIIQKPAILNAMPSIIRAIPVSNLNLIGSQSATILTNSVDQSVNGKAVLPQIVMTTSAQNVQNSSGGQRFLSPILKSGKIVNSKVEIQKPIQIAPKFLSSVPVTTVGSSESLIAKSSKGPIIFRTASLAKNDVSTNFFNQNRENVVTSSPVSLLKNTSKVQNGGTNRVNPGYKTASNSNCNKQFGRILNVAGSVQNSVKPKIIGQNSTFTVTGNSKTESSNAVPSSVKKPFVNGEHVVQIIQQGQTLHSLQQLSPAQLKQIGNVLQSRIQDSIDSNEKVVYRIVFPEELDLSNRASTNPLKNRISKRGRPKKGFARPPITTTKPVIPTDELEDAKNDRKKVVARTRSGRLSRPPRHMVRDYKHLHHLDFMQPDYDDSDGGYSDYNTHGDKVENDESPKDLLTGLEVPKRKISDHFRCPTCNKIYLGRTRMSRHFEAHPDHGSPEQLPPPTPEPELKQLSSLDPLKRKGKKRGPWAYVTPEAKSERRQMKLKEAISVCDNSEITKIAAKPVLNAQSLFNLLVLKSENNMETFISELKTLLDDVRTNIAGFLCTENEKTKSATDAFEIADKRVCGVLDVEPGLYKLSENIFEQDEDDVFSTSVDASVSKRAKLDKENIADDPNPEDNLDNFLHKRKPQLNCPEVLSALTLMPRNPIPSPDTTPDSKTKVSKLLISSPEIQNQISDSSGFQKVDISSSQDPDFQKEEVFPQGTNCSDVFAKLNYEMKTIEQGFVKLDVSSYQNKELQEELNTKMESDKLLTTDNKVSDIMQETAQIITSTCDSNIFGNGEALPNYDHITHLDILNISGVIDKNLMIDDKLVEQLNLVDQSNIVDELVSERLKIMPDNILEGNMMQNHENSMIQDADLVFDNLSDDFSRGNKS